jgi:single-stranded DNA-binding protein
VARNNQTTLRGCLASDPHFEILDGRTPHIRFDLVVPRDESQAARKAATELAKKERRDLIRVVEYGERARVDYFYLRKGAMVTVIGWNESRRYRDMDTRRWRRVLEVNAHTITPSHGADFARGDRQRADKLEELQEKGTDLEALGLAPIELPADEELDELE